MISTKTICLFICILSFSTWLHVDQKKPLTKPASQKNTKNNKKNSTNTQQRNQLPPIDSQLFKNLKHDFSQLNHKEKETNPEQYRKNMQNVIDRINDIGQAAKTHSITKEQNNQLYDMLKKSVGTMTRQEALTYNHVT